MGNWATRSAATTKVRTPLFRATVHDRRSEPNLQSRLHGRAPPPSSSVKAPRSSTALTSNTSLSNVDTIPIHWVRNVLWPRSRHGSNLGGASHSTPPREPGLRLQRRCSLQLGCQPPAPCLPFDPQRCCTRARAPAPLRTWQGAGLRQQAMVLPCSPSPPQTSAFPHTPLAGQGKALGNQLRAPV